MRSVFVLALTVSATLAGSLCLAPAAWAQPAAAAASAAAEDPGTALTAGLVSRFDVVSGNVVATAERIPEDKYAFRPTEEVRTVAEQLTHILSAQTGYCAAAGGVTAPAEARGPATTKAQIVEKLQASREFCLEVYRQISPGAMGESINVFGNTETRIFVLVQNIAHSNLHYGNLVTYMRLLGLVPPSTDG